MVVSVCLTGGSIYEYDSEIENILTENGVEHVSPIKGKEITKCYKEKTLFNVPHDEANRLLDPATYDYDCLRENPDDSNSPITCHKVESYVTEEKEFSIDSQSKKGGEPEKILVNEDKIKECTDKGYKCYQIADDEYECVKTVSEKEKSEGNDETCTNLLHKSLQEDNNNGYQLREGTHPSNEEEVYQNTLNELNNNKCQNKKWELENSQEGMRIIPKQNPQEGGKRTQRKKSKKTKSKSKKKKVRRRRKKNKNNKVH